MLPSLVVLSVARAYLDLMYAITARTNTIAASHGRQPHPKHVKCDLNPCSRPSQASCGLPLGGTTNRRLRERELATGE